MLFSNEFMVGVVSLTAAVTATITDGKRDLVHPTHIITTETYRSTCVDIVYHDDFIEITTLCASKPTVPTLIPMLRERGVVTVTNNGCTAVCQENMPGSECDVNCGTDFSTHIMLATPKLSAVPALEKRGFTTTDGDCTAVCWDLTPGTGCDVQCRENGITKMPAPTSDVKPLWTTTLIVDGCTAVCQDLNPGSECGFLCPDAYPFQAPVPTKVARAAMIEARAGYQARQAREARLDRKFGLDARDKYETVTVTVTSTPSNCSTAPIFLPEVGPEESAFSAVWASWLSEYGTISIDIKAASSETALPPAASAALSEAEAFLSSVSVVAASQHAASAATATVTTTSAVVTTPTLTASAITTKTATKTTASTETATKTEVSTTTGSTTTALTSTESDTETETPSFLVPGVTAGYSAGANSFRSKSVDGSLMAFVIGLVGNAAFIF